MAGILDTPASTAATTLAFTVGAGNQRCLIVGLTGEGTQTGQHTCSYGGQSMTFLAEAIAGSGTTQQTVSLFYLNDAGIVAASTNVITPGNITTDHSIHAASYDDCSQSTPTNTDTDTSDAATPNPLAALDIVTGAANAVVCAVSGMGNIGTAAWGGTLTERTDQQTASATGSYADDEVPSATTIACECTWTTQNRAAAVACELVHDAGVGITTVSPDPFDFDTASVTIAGSGFGATIGSSDVYLSPNDLLSEAGEVDITGAVNTWSDTSINLDLTQLSGAALALLHTMGPGARFIIVNVGGVPGTTEYFKAVTVHRPQGFQMVLGAATPGTTTARLTGMSGTFGGGRIEETAAQNPSTTTTDVASNGNREDVWSVEAKVNSREVQYDFRVLYDGNVADTITQTPQVTVSVGGTSFDGARVETVTAAETNTAQVDFVSARAETATATETATAQVDFVSDLAEVATAADTETAAVDFVSDRAETLSAADTTTGLRATPRDTAETVTAADTETAQVDFVADRVETLAAADTPAAFVAYDAEDVPETLAAADTDTAQVDFVADRAETLAAADTQDATFVLLADRVETLVAADTETAQVDFAPNRAEALAAADTESVQTDFAPAVAETVTATDTETAQVDFVAARVETLAAADTESATVGGDFSGTVDETVTAADTETAQVDFVAARAETLSPSEAQTLITDFASVRAETLAAADTPDGLISTDGAVVETVTAAETSSATVAYATDRAEALAPVSTESVTVAFAVVVAEILVATDTQDGSVPVANGKLSIPNVGYQMIVNRDDTAAPLFIAVDAGGGVPGLTVTVQIRDGDGTNYLDFDDNTFKAGPWTQKSLTLTDLGLGYYTGVLDIAAITNLPATSHLSAEYAVTGAVTAVTQAVMSFNLAKDTEVTTIHKLLKNRREINIVDGLETIYDTDDVTPLFTRGVWVDVAGTVQYNGTLVPHRVDRYA